jgi:putative tributyrin esterase
MSEYSINLSSSILCGPAEVSVIVPGPEIGGDAKEFYGSGKKYKVLWLLHGGNGDRNDWLRNTNISRYAQERGLILVIPNGLNSDFANHPEFADGYCFSDFFFDELMPFIYNWLPASDNPQDNFIAGLSMGGAATWMYGLCHPEKFGGIAPLSSPPRDYVFLEPYRNLTAGEFRVKAMADRQAFPSGYGNPKSGMLTKEINMIAKYSTVGEFLDSSECTWERFREAAAAGKLPRIYITCGTNERSYAKLLKLKDEADHLGISDITYDFISGDGHGFEFWDHVMPKVLDFFGVR